MKRDTKRLGESVFDLIVVGGGIYGATIAWEATLRGFSVAIVDRTDFGAETSASNLRIVHGGLRYLQSADLRRMRQSIRERTALLRMAPELVRPLPVLLPLHGHGMRGRLALRAALAITDLVGFDRNVGLRPDRMLPESRIMSAAETAEQLPGLAKAPWKGAALWHDALVESPERLTLGFIAASCREGAVAANYVEAIGIRRRRGHVAGIQARDVLSGETFDVRGRVIVDAGGPSAARWRSKGAASRVGWTRAFNLVLNRRLLDGFAAGVYRPGGQVFFMVPWASRTMLGTAHLPLLDPTAPIVGESDVATFLTAFNEAYPGAGLDRNDVSYVVAGLLPGEPRDAASVRLRSHFQLIEEKGEDAGVMRILGVKFTTARGVAQLCVDRAALRLGKSMRSRSARLTLPSDVARPVLAGQIDESVVDRSVREEMAVRLTDVVRRRTHLGAAGVPRESDLRGVALRMAESLGWDAPRIEREVRDCRASYLTPGLTDGAILSQRSPLAV